MTQPISKPRGSIANTAQDLASSQDGASQASPLTQGAPIPLAFTGPPDHQQPLSSAAPLALTPSVARSGDDALSRVPAPLLQLIAHFVGYPHQVGLAATSRAMRLAIAAQPAYSQIHSVFRTAVRALMANERESRRASAKDDALWAGWRSGQGDDDLGMEIFERDLEDRDLSHERLEDLSAHAGQLRAELLVQLSHYVDLHIKIAPEPFGSLFAACDNFLAAGTVQQKRQIFLDQIRPAAVGDAWRDQLSGVIESLDGACAENRFDDMQALVSSGRNLLRGDPMVRSLVADRLIETWTRDLVRMFGIAH